MSKLIIDASNGTWSVARRVDENAGWEINGQTFPTEAAAWELVKAQDPSYQYSVIDLGTIKSNTIYKTTGTKQ